MNEHAPTLRRLVDGVDVNEKPTSDRQRDDQAALLLRQFDPPPGLDDLALRRVHARLNASSSSLPADKRQPTALRLRWAIAAGVLLISTTGVAALLTRTTFFESVVRRGSIAPAVKQSVDHAGELVEVTPLEEHQEAAVTTLPAKMTTDRRAFLPKKRLARAEAPPEAPTPTPTPAPPSESPVPLPRTALSEESRSLGLALTLLRREGRPAEALDALDEYRRRFPRGVFAMEAAVARVDALLALRRRRTALVALSAMELESVPRGDELRTIRGELNADAGRCARAVKDFTVVLQTSSAPTALKQRALVGRMRCREIQGDNEGAAADAALQRTHAAQAAPTTKP